MRGHYLETMHARARAVRAQAAVRHWTYRQRDLSAGVWFKVRRTLADADQAYAISEDDTRRLMTEGHEPESCGAQLAPRKNIFFADRMCLSTLASRRRIPVGLGPQFLTAPAAVLLRFDV